MAGQKPSGYSFLPQLADCSADQISIEAAQPKLDLGILKDLSGKTIMLGVIDLGDQSVETPDIVAARIRAALKYVEADRLVVAERFGVAADGAARRYAGRAFARTRAADGLADRLVGTAFVACAAERVAGNAGRDTASRRGPAHRGTS